MLEFSLWLEQQEIPEKAIKIALPKVRMQRAGACGPQALRAICLYFKIGPEDEKEFINILGSNADKGTPPKKIIEIAQKLGFQVRAKTGMNVNNLINYLNKGVPIICAMQAYGEPKKYNKDKFGHYVVIIGYDKINIYFEDSSISGGKRGFLMYEEFLKRWHDKDADGNNFDQLGIAMWINKDVEPSKKLDKAEKIQ